MAELEPVLRRTGDLWTMQWAVFESSFVPLAAGDDAAALDRIGAALEICRRSGYTAYEPFFVAHLGWVHRLAGRLDDALREGRRAVELAAAAPAHLVVDDRVVPLRRHPARLRGAGRGRRRAPAGRGRWPTCPGAEAYLLRCLGPLAEATGDAGVLRAGRRAAARHPGRRRACAWLLGADAYLGRGPRLAAGRRPGPGRRRS